MIDTRFSESDAEDIRRVLEFQPEGSSQDFASEELANSLSHLVSSFEGMRRDILFESFKRIKKS